MVVTYESVGVTPSHDGMEREHLGVENYYGDGESLVSVS